MLSVYFITVFEETADKLRTNCEGKFFSWMWAFQNKLGYFFTVAIEFSNNKGACNYSGMGGCKFIS